MLPRLLASDPGLNRLRMALQSVLTIAAAMAAEWGLVRLTHALWIDAHGVPAAIAAAQHHGMTVIAVMIGAVVGMIASFAGGMFPSSGRLLIGYAAMPVFMIAGLALGLGLAGSRTVSLLMLVVILAAGAYSRRWGPLGFVGGQMFFMGDFFGFFLSGSVHLRDLGWLAAEIGLGALVALLAQFTLFYPGRRAALARLQRSYDARRRDLVELAIRMIDEREEAPRLRQLLDRRLVALNETALMIDATLNQPGSIPPGWSAEALHQILFDIELAAGNMGLPHHLAPALGADPGEDPRGAGRRTRRARGRRRAGRRPAAHPGGGGDRRGGHRPGGAAPVRALGARPLRRPAQPAGGEEAGRVGGAGRCR